MLYRVVWQEDHVAYVDTDDEELGVELSKQEIFARATEDNGTCEDRLLISVKEQSAP